MTARQALAGNLPGVGQHGYPLGETHFTWDGLRLLQEHRHQQTSLYLYEDEGYEPIRQKKRLRLKDHGLWASIKSSSPKKTITLDK